MQETSALYTQFVANPAHWFQTRVGVYDKDGTQHWLQDSDGRYESVLFAVSRSRPGMPSNLPSCGGALSSTLKVTCINPTDFAIPRMARVDVQYRVTIRAEGETIRVEGETNPNTSIWIAGGTYFVDTRTVHRSESIDTLDLECYDAMMKAEADYPDTNHAWPYSDKNVVAEIASTIGVTVDSRTNQYITAGHMINLPADYTMRETLGHIAGLYGGNFIVSPENKLLFVPLFGFDAEESGNYLADENGNALLFGNEGWFIYV